MPRGVEFSEDLCWAVIQMAPLLTPEEIQAYTTMSLGQQKQILLQWRKTGEVKRQKDHRIYGRPRHLTPQEVVVQYSPVVASKF